MKLMKKFIVLFFILNLTSLFSMEGLWRRIERVQERIDRALYYFAGVLPGPFFLDDKLLYLVENKKFVGFLKIYPQSSLNKVLFIAVERAGISKQTVRELLYAGADVNGHDTSGLTPLMRATQKKDRDKVKLLLEKGAYLNLVAPYQTVLGYALGDLEIVQLLLNQMSVILNMAGLFEKERVIDEEIKNKIKNISFEGIDTIGQLYEALDQQLYDFLVRYARLKNLDLLHVFDNFARHHKDKFSLLSAEIDHQIHLAINGEESFRRHVEYIRH